MDFSPPIPTGTTELTGTVRHIIWSNWDDDSQVDRPCVIARISVANSGGEEVAVAGPCPRNGMEPGASLRFLGRWKDHHKYGKQLSFSTFIQAEPANHAGVIRYLVKIASNIGEAKAERLWAKFGPDAVRVVRENPDEIAESGILSFEQANEASADLQKYAHLEQTRIDLFGLFDRRGFPGSIIEACIERWGATAATRIRKNPFILMVDRKPMSGAGFRRCDRLYLELGHNPHRLKRRMLAAWHALRTEANGHTWMHFSAVRDATIRSASISSDDFSRAIKLGVRAKWLAIRNDSTSTPWIAEFSSASHERGLAEKIQTLRAAPCVWSNLPESISTDILSEHQRDVLANAIREPVGILAGTPGTGKTFTAAQLVRAIANQYGLGQIAVCAPTGKASVRCTDALRSYGIDLRATTIHRTLEVVRSGYGRTGWQFVHCSGYPFPYRFIVVDEVSMLDTDLAFALFDACAPGTHILLIGDPYQLPPVGHGAPLRDMIAAGVPCGELTIVRRNSGMIVEACAKIKAGDDFQVSDRYVKDQGINLKHVPSLSPEEAIDQLRVLLRTLREKEVFDPVWQTQVLVSVNGKSKLSRVFLNRILQAELNPFGKHVSGNPFRVGDKIISLKNGLHPAVGLQRKNQDKPIDCPDTYTNLLHDEFLANGDIGRVIAVGPTSAIAQFFSPDRTVKILVDKKSQPANDEDNPSRQESQVLPPDSEADAGTLSYFDLAFAITVHKSQGSESPCVIVMIDDSPGAKRICSREHVYTAISRAKDLCITIGKMPVMRGMCRKITLDGRKTFLRELLTQEESR